MTTQKHVDDAYKTLCLPKDEHGEFAAHEAYKALSLIYHPDRNKDQGGPNKDDAFKKVGNAWDCLKKAYDDGYAGGVKRAWDEAVEKKHSYEKTLSESLTPKEKEKLLKAYDDDIKWKVRKAITKNLGLDDDATPSATRTRPSRRGSRTLKALEAPGGTLKALEAPGGTLKALETPGYVPYSRVIAQVGNYQRGQWPQQDVIDRYWRRLGHMSHGEAKGRWHDRITGEDAKNAKDAEEESLSESESYSSSDQGNSDLPALHEFLTVRPVKAGIVRHNFQKSLSYQTNIGRYDLFSNATDNSKSTIEVLQVSSTSQNASYTCFYGDKGSIPILIMRGHTKNFMAFVPRSKDVYAVAIFDSEVWAVTHLTAGKAKDKQIEYGPSAGLSNKANLKMIELYELPNDPRSTSTEKQKWTLNHGLPTDPSQAKYVSHYIDLRSDMETTIVRSDGQGEHLWVASGAGDVIVLSDRANYTSNKLFCLSGRGQRQRLACQFNSHNWAIAIIREGDERIGKIWETGEVSLKDDDYIKIERKVAEAKTAESTQRKPSSSKKPKALTGTKPKDTKKRR